MTKQDIEDFIEGRWELIKRRPRSASAMFYYVQQIELLRSQLLNVLNIAPQLSIENAIRFIRDKIKENHELSGQPIWRV